MCVCVCAYLCDRVVMYKYRENFLEYKICLYTWSIYQMTNNKSTHE